MSSESWDIITGDCREILDTLPERSVQCVVTSPPYWGQRSYGNEDWEGGDPDCAHHGSQRFDTPVSEKQSSNKASSVEASTCTNCPATRSDQGIGLEVDVQQWVDEIVGVFRKVWRVLRDDGTLWLNLGDKYWGTGGGNNNTGLTGRPMPEGDVDERGSPRHDRNTWKQKDGLKSKDLIGLPWRLAFALQADGWYLRRDIIWHKPNPMPESATDRPSTAHEYVFLLTKKPRYFYDQDAVRTAISENTHARYKDHNRVNPKAVPTGWDSRVGEGGHGTVHKLGRTPSNPVKQNTSFSAAINKPVDAANLRSVWTIPTQSFSGPHYATYPEKLVEPCIKAGTSEKGECPECGAPWKRTIVTGESSWQACKDAGWTGKHGVMGSAAMPTVGTELAPDGVSTGGLGWAASRETTGWQPTCTHDSEPVPQTILDPFSGAGTTGLVAARFGRRYIGIELNLEYAEMSRRRIAEAVGATSPEIADELGMPVQAAMFE